MNCNFFRIFACHLEKHKEQMKITKIRTKLGEFQTPVTTDLDLVVARMRSEETKKAADLIAHNAMASRLAMQEGMPRYHLEATNLLPYLIFTATFGRGGLDNPKTTTGLLLLNIACPEGQRQVMDMRHKVSQVPYTMLAFAGSSGVTLKVIVTVGNESNDIDMNFLNDARESAYRLYNALTGCNFYVDELTPHEGCRMSYDAQLYYNPEAQQLPVIRESGDVLKAYKGTQVEDGGEVVWYPEYNERERLQMEYQACLSKAIDEEADDSERCVQLLADYCAKARLGEESCVKRTQGRFRFRDVSDDLIRKIFRNAYKQPYEGRALSQMNEKERIMRSIENFLNRRYQLRFNVVKQVTEFRKNDLLFKPWEPLTDRELKSIAVEEMKEGGESWMRDIQTYIESAHITDYNPVHEFLAGCGEWDGKRDYIEEFARRLPTDYEDWPKYFHRWFLAMVAQALDMNRDHGNSMVPMLIGGQGIMKSTFCKNILPPSMREYYMDDIKMDNAEQVERVLGRMWLVCIDEYNAKTDREQAKIKRILTEKDVQVRKMRSDQYTMTPRLCSFIATTNDPTPLPSGDGSRRYLCVEVTGPVNMKGRIPYKQMFAQAVRELHQSNCLYWFTSDDEARIQRHNSRYQQESSLETILQNLFSPTNQHRKENFWQVSDIQQELSKHLKSKDLPNLSTLGMSIKHLQRKRRVVKGLRGYYLQRKGV